MRIRVQVVIEGNEGVPPEVHEVADLQRADLGTDTLGLQLAEAKELLARMQEVVVDEQVRACLAAKVACPTAGDLAGTRTNGASPWAPCSAPCAFRARAGTTAIAGHRSGRPS